jgi:carbonic anhydrase
MRASFPPARSDWKKETRTSSATQEGGRGDALRSLVVSQRLLGTREVAVIHHTDCGMLTFTNEQLRDRIRRELDADASSVDFLPFADVEKSVRDDVDELRRSPLIPRDVPVRGFVYDVRTGRLSEVRQA